MNSDFEKRIDTLENDVRELRTDVDKKLSKIGDKIDNTGHNYIVYFFQLLTLLAVLAELILNYHK